MSHLPPSFHLSDQAFKEYKEIYLAEFGDDGTTDEEHRARAIEVLQLFYLLLTADPKEEKAEEPKGSPVTNQESTALEYIRNTIAEGKTPTVRGISEAISLRSSRSGLRMLKSLIGRGLVRRNKEGKIQV